MNQQQQLTQEAKDAGFRVIKDGTRHRLLEKNGIRITISYGGNVGPRDVENTRAAIRRAQRLDPEVVRIREARRITAGEVRPGRKVRALRDFVDVPVLASGEILEDYGPGFFVRWENGILDAFDKQVEIRWLEAIA